MTDMTVKEYAYLQLTQYKCIPESLLRRKLLEVYRESCVDCILREIREDEEHILCRPVKSIDDEIHDRLLILIPGDD